MKHFLVTRFNLKKADWKTAKDGSIVLNEDWLNHRFDLFEKYCLPSVRNQINHDFIWCVYFDSMTPSHYKQRIQNISKNNKCFREFYIESMNELLPAFQNYISENIEKEENCIITTRLDNDDIIHKNFINQSKF